MAGVVVAAKGHVAAGLGHGIAGPRAHQIGGHAIDRHRIARLAGANPGDLGLVIAGDIGRTRSHHHAIKPGEEEIGGVV